jgi:hypothetical protein
MGGWIFDFATPVELSRVHSIWVVEDLPELVELIAH